MKKDILFVMNNLNCGGAEKALISLLEVIDYSKYNVDLVLFKKEGIFLSKVPENVNILQEPEGYKYFDMPIKDVIIDCLIKGRIDIVLWRILSGYIFRNEENHARCEQKVWKYISKSIKKMTKKYDVCIGYLEKNPVYFCVDKVNANKKIGFIHTDYEKLGMDYKIDINYFGKLDNIVTVSDQTAKNLKKIFPEYNKKIKVVYNIVSPEIIKKMSLENVDMDDSKICITSVGRLHSAKGFDIAVQACKILIDNGYDIKWYIIGEGEERKRLEQIILDKKLSNRMILVGIKENPYPYIKNCDVYVQTSLFEGRCLTITEAKILNKPIVSTNFDSIYDQINNGENGIIVNKNPQAIYEGITKIIKDDKLRNTLINRTQIENYTESGIDEFYNLLKI